MPTGCLVALGGSAGAIEALTELLPQLPPRFPAPVLVAIHRRPREPFQLEQVLRRESLLPVQTAADGQTLEPGTIVLAPPNRQLTVHRDGLKIRFGPTENDQRPSIDTMLRSAAMAFGANAIGVLLSGTSVDGVAGLEAVHRNAGTTIVQEPADAQFPGLPEAAIRDVPVDHVVPVADLPTLFEKLTSGGAPATVDALAPFAIESATFDRDPATGELAGRPSQFACPDCGGVLWRLDDDEGVVRFRCRVGHAWNADALLDAQDRQSEAALWAALRSLEEHVELASRMAGLSARRGGTRFTERYSRRAARLQAHVDALRRLLAVTSPAPRTEPGTAD